MREFLGNLYKEISIENSQKLAASRYRRAEDRTPMPSPENRLSNNPHSASGASRAMSASREAFSSGVAGYQWDLQRASFLAVLDVLNEIEAVLCKT